MNWFSSKTNLAQKHHNHTRDLSQLQAMFQEIVLLRVEPFRTFWSVMTLEVSAYHSRYLALILGLSLRRGLADVCSAM